MTPAERRDRIADLKQLKEGIKHSIRAIITDLDMPTRTHDQIARNEQLIAKMQRENETLKANLEFGPERIEAFELRRDEINREILLLENGDKIEKLMKLANEINEMETVS